jgi:hypothetical protein
MPQFRQGDVLITKIRRPKQAGARVPLDQGRVILAYGEVTGHAHAVVPATPEPVDVPAAQLFDAPDGSRYLLVDRPCALVHDEHGSSTARRRPTALARPTCSGCRRT